MIRCGISHFHGMRLNGFLSALIVDYAVACLTCLSAVVLVITVAAARKGHLTQHTTLLSAQQYNDF